MRWRTEITVPRTGFEIDHSTSMVMLGSCFTDEVGTRMRQQLFDVSVNPLGTLFNPISIADAISDALAANVFSRDELFEVDGTWRSLRRHSRFALPGIDDTLDLLNSSLEATRQRLLSADILIVTFGSAIVHRHTPTGRVVANCHKLPAAQFTVEPLNVSTITMRWTKLIEQLRAFNPKIKIIFTVSPVRHISYGLQRDRLSKSTLIVAVNDLIANDTSSSLYSFPSYEIVVDDLRDYRWYADDMVHPSKQAVDYVYDLFRNATMQPVTIAEAETWQRLARRMAHRHSTPGAAAEFREATIGLAEELAGTRTSLFQRFISLCDENKHI